MQGVGSDFPGARVISFEPAAPLVNRGTEMPLAFGRKKQQTFPLRYVRDFDVVTVGLKNLGRGTTIREPMVSLNPIDNHYLGLYLPWSPKSKSVGVRLLNGVRGVHQAAEGARRAIGETVSTARAVVGQGVRQVGNAISRVF